MLIIDVKSIYEYAGLSFSNSSSKLFLGSSITDCVYTCLVDLGFNPVNGRYVVVPETVKKLLSSPQSAQMPQKSPLRTFLRQIVF